MNHDLRLMAILAHPDDESLGFGGTLAKYAAEGVAVHLVTATRGERGRFYSGREARPDVVGRVREEELRAASQVLGIRDVSVLGYPDGGLDSVGAGDVIAAIAEEIQRVKPQVILTFGPEGAYGHPDHIAISQFASAAVLYAAHRVSKLYYMAWRQDKWSAYQAAFRELASMVDGVRRLVTPWPDWAVTTEIETSSYWPSVWEAVRCHQTQMSIYEKLGQLTEEHQRQLWGSQEFYRAFSTVNGGRRVERDLFEGLR